MIQPKQLYKRSRWFLHLDSHVYHPCFPSTICWATSKGNFTPRINSSVSPFMASIQASNGERQTYQPAQKNPTGQARNHRTSSQMIAHKTFISNENNGILNSDVLCEVYMITLISRTDLSLSKTKEKILTDFNPISNPRAPGCKAEGMLRRFLWHNSTSTDEYWEQRKSRSFFQGIVESLNVDKQQRSEAGSWGSWCRLTTAIQNILALN